MKKRKKLSGKDGLTTIAGVTVLAGSDGQRFYDKHMRPSARKGKKKKRRTSKASRRGNR